MHTHSERREQRICPLLSLRALDFRFRRIRLNNMKAFYRDLRFLCKLLYNSTPYCIYVQLPCYVFVVPCHLSFSVPAEISVYRPLWPFPSRAPILHAPLRLKATLWHLVQHRETSSVHKTPAQTAAGSSLSSGDCDSKTLWSVND